MRQVKVLQAQVWLGEGLREGFGCLIRQLIVMENQSATALEIGSPCLRHTLDTMRPNTIREITSSIILQVASCHAQVIDPLYDDLKLTHLPASVKVVSVKHQPLQLLDCGQQNVAPFPLEFAVDELELIQNTLGIMKIIG